VAAVVDRGSMCAPSRQLAPFGIQNDVHRPRRRQQADARAVRAGSRALGDDQSPCRPFHPPYHRVHCALVGIRRTDELSCLCWIVDERDTDSCISCSVSSTQLLQLVRPSDAISDRLPCDIDSNSWQHVNMRPITSTLPSRPTCAIDDISGTGGLMGSMK